MPFGFYGGEEAAAASAAGYAKLTFSVFSRCPLLAHLGSLLSFSSSTGTITGNVDDLVTLGAT